MEAWKKMKSWQKVTIVVGIIAVVVFVAAIIINTLLSEPKVTIKFDERINIPPEELKRVRMKLVDAIRENTEGYNKEITYVGNARDYKEISDGSLNNASFIVDFNSIRESYNVSVTWPNPDDGSPNILISCPLLASKYPTTPCKTEMNSSSEIENYLPYIGSTELGKKYKIVGRYFDDGKLYLDIQVGLNGSDEEMNQALVAAKEWIEEIGFDANEYTFTVSRANVSDKTLMFYGDEILTAAYNGKYLDLVSSGIENVVFSADEMRYSQDNRPVESDANVYYDAIIDATSVSSFDAYTTKFNVNISDGRAYSVITKTDSLNEDFNYLYSSIIRDGGDTIFVFINGDKKEKNSFIEFVRTQFNKTSVNTVENILE